MVKEGLFRRLSLCVVGFGTGIIMGGLVWHWDGLPAIYKAIMVGMIVFVLYVDWKLAFCNDKNANH